MKVGRPSGETISTPFIAAEAQGPGVSGGGARDAEELVGEAAVAGGTVGAQKLVAPSPAAIQQLQLVEALPVMAAAWHQLDSADAPKQLQAQAKPVAPPAPPVPVRRTVVIYGLENGVREHSFQ